MKGIEKSIQDARKHFHEFLLNDKLGFDSFEWSLERVKEEVGRYYKEVGRYYKDYDSRLSYNKLKSIALEETICAFIDTQPEQFNNFVSASPIKSQRLNVQPIEQPFKQVRSLLLDLQGIYDSARQTDKLDIKASQQKYEELLKVAGDTIKLNFIPQGEKTDFGINLRSAMQKVIRTLSNLKEAYAKESRIYEIVVNPKTKQLDTLELEKMEKLENFFGALLVNSSKGRKLKFDRDTHMLKKIELEEELKGCLQEFLAQRANTYDSFNTIKKIDLVFNDTRKYLLDNYDTSDFSYSVLLGAVAEKTLEAYIDNCIKVGFDELLEGLINKSDFNQENGKHWLQLHEIKEGLSNVSDLIQKTYNFDGDLSVFNMFNQAALGYNEKESIDNGFNELYNPLEQVMSNIRDMVALLEQLDATKSLNENNEIKALEELFKNGLDLAGYLSKGRKKECEKIKTPFEISTELVREAKVLEKQLDVQVITRDNQEIFELSDEIERLKEENKSLKETENIGFLEMSRLVKGAKNEAYNEYKEIMLEKEEENEGLVKTIEVQKEDFKELSKTLKEIREKLNLSECGNSNLNSDLEQLRKNNEALNQSVASYSESNGNLRKHLKELSEKLDKSNKANEALEEDNKILQGKNDILSKQLEEEKSKSSVKELEFLEKIAELEKQLSEKNSLSGKTVEVQTENESRDEEIQFGSLEQTIPVVTNDKETIKGLQEIIDGQEITIGELTVTVKSQQEELEAKDEIIEDLEDELEMEAKAKIQAQEGFKKMERVEDNAKSINFM